MKFIQIYQDCVKHWPNKISLHDAKLLPSSGIIIPDLQKSYEKADLI